MGKQNREGEFLQYLSDWEKSLKPGTFKSLGIDPGRSAIIIVDMINGFCHVGPLASSQVRGIIPEVVNLATLGYNIGVRHYLSVQDAHDPDTPEFVAFPPHCLKGSSEARLIPELSGLPCASHIATFEKNSLSPAYHGAFDRWIGQHPDTETFILSGNCTDLCIYTLAMHLRLSANSANLKRRVIVPANTVATYDLPAAEARKIGAMAHDGRLLQRVFLHHLALNGIEVVSSLGK